MAHISFALARLDFHKEKSLARCVLFVVVLESGVLISSFSRSKCLYTGPFGKGAPGIKSIECLNWQCGGTPIGEVNMSLYSSTTLSTCFCYVARLCVEVVNVATTFFSL